MAFPTSYVNGNTVKLGLSNASGPVLDTDAFKVALFTNTLATADKSAAENYGAGVWASNEVASSNYTAGGKALTNVSTSVAAGNLVVDDSAATLAWTSVTFTTRGAAIYNDTTTADSIHAAVNFGSDLDVSAGTFTITWDATNGLWHFTF